MKNKSILQSLRFLTLLGLMVLGIGNAWGGWTRVTKVSDLTSGGTFIIGYEATANSGTIVPMQNTGTATTSAAGLLYSGTSNGSSGSGTITMSTVTETSKYEVTIAASTKVDGAIVIKCGDNYVGNTNTKNNLKLFTSEATTTAFTPTIGTNNVVTLKINANATYHTLQYNSSSPRFAVYGGTQSNVVIYKKEVTTYTVTYDANNATSGKVPTDDTKYASGASVTVLGNTGNLARTDYVFSGWNTKDDGSGTTYTAGNTFNISENTTLYAKWTPKTTPTFSIADLEVNYNDAITPVISTDNTDSYSVTYSSSDENVVFADGNELVTMGVGEATITADMAATTNFKAAQTTFTVTVKAAVTKYDINLKQPDYANIAATPSSAAKGTEVTLSYSNVTAHYHFVSWTVLDSESQEITVSNNKFTMPDDDVTVSATFEEDEKHNAIFSVNGVTSSTPYYEGENITFPQTADAPTGKVFTGWYGSEYSNPTTAPTYVTSATMGTSDVTYYAVFATRTGTGEPTETLSQTLSYDTWTYSGTTADKGTYRLFGNDAYVESAEFDLSKLSKVIVYGGTFGGTSYKYLTIGDGTNTWKSVTVSGSSQTGVNEYTGGTALSGTGKLRVTSNSGDGSSNGIRISKVEIYTTQPGYSYSDYTTSVVVKTLTGIQFGGSLTKTVYTEEETFNPAGITVLASYEGIVEKEDVTSQSTITYSSDPLTTSVTFINVAASYGGFNINNDYAITVNAIPTYTITASAATGGSYTVKIGDAEAANVPAEGTTYQSRANKVITMTSAASEGYKLHSTPFVVKDADDAAVSVSKDGDNYSFTMPAKAVTITAQYVQQFSIATTTPEHGTITSIKDGDGNDITATSKGSKVWVTVTPDTHYTLSAISVKKADESPVTVTVDSENANRASFTMPQSNVTVSATFAEMDKHNVTFYVNDEADEPVSVYEGDAVEFPSSVTTPTGYAFMGWTVDKIDGSLDTDEGITYVKEATMGDANLVYYAVFAKINGSGTPSVQATFNFISGDWDIPVGADNKSWSEGTYTDGTYSVTLVGSLNNGYCITQTSGTSPKSVALLFGKTGAQLTLQQFKFAISKLKVYGATGGTASSSVVWNVYSGQNVANAGETAITGLSTDEMVEVPIKSAYQNDQLSIKVTSSHNMQISKIDVYDTGVTYSNYCTGVGTFSTPSSEIYTTFYTTDEFVMPKGAQGGVVNAKNTGTSTVTVDYVYESGATVPAQTPLVIKGEKGTTYNYYKSYTGAKKYTETNYLMGVPSANYTTVGPDDGSYYFYKLTYNNSTDKKIGFYWGAADGAAFTMKTAGKAYLALPQSAGIKGISLEDLETGINVIEADIDVDSNDVIYNLGGQKLNKLQKGINIVNGRKVYVK